MAGGTADSFIDRDVLIYGERDPRGTASGVACEIDPVGPWLVTIDVPHHEIHEGEGLSYWFNASLASNASAYWFISLGDRDLHFRITGIACSMDKVTVSLYEGASASAGYSASATFISRNREILGTSSARILTGSGVVTPGTLLDVHYIGGGTGVGGAKSGGTQASDEEWILAESTIYAIKVHNGSSSAGDVNIRCFVYGEPH